MDKYKASSHNQKNFSLTLNDKEIGELVYPKWYSFDAFITIDGKKEYQFKTAGRWHYNIELQQQEKTLIELKISWEGIVLKTYFEEIETDYFLKLRTPLTREYILIDANETELISVDAKFQWKKFRFDYIINTTDKFTDLAHKELFLFTILHSINYHKALAMAASAE